MRISDWSSDVCSSDLSGRRNPRMHPFRRPLLLLIVLTIISPALLAAYGEHTPAPLADTQPRFDTTRAGSPGLARRAVPLWPETSTVLQEGIRELDDGKTAVPQPSFLPSHPDIPPD